MLTNITLRFVFWVSGIVFGIIWAVLGAGWATIVVLCGWAGLYLGVAIETGVGLSALSASLSALLEPLRRMR
jgi:hypothetical protein